MWHYTNVNCAALFIVPMNANAAMRKPSVSMLNSRSVSNELFVIDNEPYSTLLMNYVLKKVLRTIFHSLFDFLYIYEFSEKEHEGRLL